MEIKYIAYDGTVFYNEKECLDYEYNKKLVRKDLICLDENFRLIDDDNLNFRDEVYCILAKNNSACNALKEEFTEQWVDTPEEGFQPNIVYWWNNDIMEWVIVQKELKKLKEKVKFYEDILAIEYFNN